MIGNDSEDQDRPDRQHLGDHQRDDRHVEEDEHPLA